MQTEFLSPLQRDGVVVMEQRVDIFRCHAPTPLAHSTSTVRNPAFTVYPNLRTRVRI